MRTAKKGDLTIFSGTSFTYDKKYIDEYLEYLAYNQQTDTALYGVRFYAEDKRVHTMLIVVDVRDISAVEMLEAFMFWTLPEDEEVLKILREFDFTLANSWECSDNLVYALLNFKFKHMNKLPSCHLFHSTSYCNTYVLHIAEGIDFLVSDSIVSLHYEENMYYPNND